MYSKIHIQNESDGSLSAMVCSKPALEAAWAFDGIVTAPNPISLNAALQARFGRPLGAFSMKVDRTVRQRGCASDLEALLVTEN